MIDQNALGPHIKARDLEKLPQEKKEKYRKELLEARIAQAQAMLFELFSEGRENYLEILQKFNEAALESDEIKALLLENKKITEIMEVVLYVMITERYAFVSDLEEINKGIKTVFGSDLGKEPWKEKMLTCIGDNAIYMDQVDNLATLFGELNIPEEEIRTALAKSLNNTETQSRGTSVEAMLTRKKYGIEIEPEKIKSMKDIGDRSLKLMMLPHAVELYEALILIGYDIGEERSSIVSIYRSGRDEAQKTELIKNIGMEAGIIIKPKEPEKRDERETKSEDIKKTEPWWKFW